MSVTAKSRPAFLRMNATEWWPSQRDSSPVSELANERPASRAIKADGTHRQLRGTPGICRAKGDTSCRKPAGCHANASVTPCAVCVTIVQMAGAARANWAVASGRRLNLIKIDRKIEWVGDASALGMLRDPIDARRTRHLDVHSSARGPRPTAAPRSRRPRGTLNSPLRLFQPTDAWPGAGQCELQASR